jgi:type II secretory ATPase GspE/PulE/Tfp pilus assembly ATPase PilB-like protein
MKIEPFLLVSTLNLIVAQRLIRKLADSKEQYILTDVEFQKLSKTIDFERILKDLRLEKIVEPTATWKTIPFYRAKGTAEYPDGYSGRIGIHEILKVTPSIKELIMRNATSMLVEEQAKKEGMLTMFEDGVFKAVQGITTLEEVLRVITE